MLLFAGLWENESSKKLKVDDPMLGSNMMPSAKMIQPAKIIVQSEHADRRANATYWALAEPELVEIAPCRRAILQRSV